MPISKWGLQHHSPRTANLGISSFGIWYHVLRLLSLCSFVLVWTPIAQLYTVSTSSKGLNGGTLVKVPAWDPEATLFLSCSWKTSKGTPEQQTCPTITITSATIRTTIITSVVILVYSFIYTIARRGDDSLRHFFEENLKENLKMRRERIPGFRQKKTMDVEKLLDEALDDKC